MTEPYFDGSTYQRLRVTVRLREERRQFPGYVADREHIVRAIDALKDTLPLWIEEHCATKASADPGLPPTQRFGTSADPNSYEGWVWNFYQHS